MNMTKQRRGSLGWAIYFARLPCVSIGICLVLNAVAVVGIKANQSGDGNSATLYWIYVYELFFVLSLAVQVQMYMMDTSERRRVAWFVAGAMSGICLIEQCCRISVDIAGIHGVGRCDKGDAESITAPFHFVFPAPRANDITNNGAEDEQEYTLDPTKASFVNPTGS